MLKAEDLVIRCLHDLPDLTGCVALQQKIWGFADIDAVPEQVFLVAAKTGGQVLGAFHRERLVGFALSFAAQRHSLAYLHSHMVAVLPECENQGIGRLLKYAQRQEALACGMNLIEWTFDPFQPKNAYFNIAVLGAIARRYIANCYGRTSSHLHRSLPTDRLVAEWWLQSPRVQNRFLGKPHNGMPGGEYVSVPANIQEICRSSPDEAEQIQLRLRKTFESSFANGLAAVDFKSDSSQGKYLMEPYEN